MQTENSAAEGFLDAIQSSIWIWVAYVVVKRLFQFFENLHVIRLPQVVLY